MVQNTKTYETVAGVWGDFLRETSFHGCRNIRSGRRSILQRIVWGIMLLIMTGMLLKMLIDMYAVYRSYPFKTVTNLKRHKELDFPAVSVCALNTMQKSQVNLSEEWSRYLYSTDGGAMFGSLNISKPGEDLPADLAEFAISKEDFILWAKAGSITLNVTRDFMTAGSICFSFNTPGTDGHFERFRVKKSEGLKLLLDIHTDEYAAPAEAEGAMILVHNPHEIQFEDEQLVIIEPGSYTKIKLTQTSFKFLPLPYKSFDTGEETCDDVYSSDFKHSLRYHNTYTVLDCLMECWFVPIAEKCGCRYGAHLDSMDVKVCGTSELNSCYWPQFSAVRHTTTCRCPRPCSLVQYDLHSSSAAFPSGPLTQFLVDEKLIKSADYARRNLILVTISFERMIVQHVEHIPEMSWGDIFGKLGGQMGFFLGASLLTLSELVEISIMTLWIVGSRMFRLDKTGVNPVNEKPNFLN